MVPNCHFVGNEHPHIFTLEESKTTIFFALWNHYFIEEIKKGKRSIIAFLDE